MGRKPIAENIKQAVYEFAKEHPEYTYKKLGEILNASPDTVSIICRQRGLHRNRPTLSEVSLGRLLLGTKPDVSKDGK
jgi:hypothetical protein